MRASTASTSSLATSVAVPTSTSTDTVTGVLAQVRLHPNVKVVISDTSANIQKYLGALSRISNNITRVTVTGGTLADNKIALSAGDLKAYEKLLAKFEGSNAAAGYANYQFAVSGVTAANAVAVADNKRVGSFTISDSSANVGKNLVALDGSLLVSAKLSAIFQTGTAAPIGMTRSVYYNLNRDTMNRPMILEKIKGYYSVALTDATAAQAVGYSSDVHVKSVAIKDTTFGIETNLDGLKGLGVRLKQIAVDRTTDAENLANGADNNGVIDLTAQQLASNSFVLGKIISSYHLAVHEAKLAQTATINQNVKVVTIDIEDTGANIVKNIALLAKLGSHLNHVSVTDSGNPLSMTDAQLVTYNDMLSKFSGADSNVSSTSHIMINVTQCSALSAALHLQGSDDRIRNIDVADTAANISTNYSELSALQDGEPAPGDAFPKDILAIRHVKQLGKAAPVVMTYDQFDASASFLNKFTGGYSLKVTDVLAADAKVLIDDHRNIAAIAVSDSSANISIDANLSDLNAIGLRLEKITLTNETEALSLSYQQYVTNRSALAKIVGDFGTTLSGVKATDAKAVAADSHVVSFSVLDTAARMTSNFDTLRVLGEQIDGWALADGGSTNPMSLTDAQFTAGTEFLAKFSLADSAAAYALAVTAATAARAQIISDESPGNGVISIDVADTSLNIADALDDLAVNGLLHRITQVGTPASLVVSASQLVDDAEALLKISGNYSLAVTGAGVHDAADLCDGNKRISSIEVVGSGGDIVGALSNLQALGSKLISITQEDTVAISLELTNTEYKNYAPTLKKITGNYGVAVSEVHADDAAVFANDVHLETMTVLDTAAKISANFNALKTIGARLFAVTQEGGGDLALSASQSANGSSLLEKIGGGVFTAVVSSVAASDALTLSEDTRVTTINNQDTASNLALLQTVDGYEDPVAYLDVLQGLGDVIGSISLLVNVSPTTSTPTAAARQLALTAAQVTADADTLAKISGNYTLAVRQALATDVHGYLSDTRVTAVSVDLSAMDIQENLSDLSKLGKRLTTITQTDAKDPEVETDLGVAISLTDAELVANGAVFDKIDGPYRLAVSGVSSARAIALATDERVDSVEVSDNGANISSNFDALVGMREKISGFGGSDSLSMSLSAAQYASAEGVELLTKIEDGPDYTAAIAGVAVGNSADIAIDSHVSSFTIRDSGSSVMDGLDALNGLATAVPSMLTGVVLTDPGTALDMTATQFGASTTLLGKITSGRYLLNIADADAAAATAAGFGSLRDNTHVLGITISDAADSIVTNLPGFADNAKVTAISLTPDATATQQTLALEVGILQDAQNVAILQKITNTYTITVNGATVADLADLADVPRVTKINVDDTSAHLSGEGFDAVLALGDVLNEMTVTNPAESLGLTYGQWQAATTHNLWDKVSTSSSAYTLDVVAVPADHAAAVGDDTHVDRIYVEDTSASVADHWVALKALTIGVTGDRLQTIHVTDPDPIILSQAQFDESTAFIALFFGDHDVVAEPDPAAE